MIHRPSERLGCPSRESVAEEVEIMDGCAFVAVVIKLVEGACDISGELWKVCRWWIGYPPSPCAPHGGEVKVKKRPVEFRFWWG